MELKLAAIPADPQPPSEGSIAPNRQLGIVRAKATDAERRSIVDEWFEEVRLSRDRSIELIVGAPHLELVFAAYGRVGSTDVGRLELRPEVFVPLRETRAA